MPDSNSRPAGRQTARTPGNGSLSASVIVPVKNREELLLRALDSIAAQDFRPLEIMVVDNGSTDNTVLNAEQWARDHASEPRLSVILTREERPGASAARNKGVGLSSGQVLFFFDSDDTMRPGLIRKAMDMFEAYPEADLVGWRVAMHKLDGKLRTSHLWTQANQSDMHLVHAVYMTQGIAWRRDFHLATGGWDPQAMAWNDWELGVRAMLLQPRVEVMDEVLVDVHSQADSITGRDFFSKRGRWERSLDKAAAECAKSNHPQRKRMARVIAYRKAILAAFYHREGHPSEARALLREAMDSACLRKRHRLALRLAYAMTRRGLRGAFRFVGSLL